MQRSALSLRSLELFQMVARSGSVQKVAADTGLSISTVSHHLKTLETTLGANLLDHARRPMVLTPSGTVFLRHVEEGLSSLRRGEIELTSGSLENARDLRLGIIDDFDTEVAPELAKFLAKAMPRCTFVHHTRASHDIIALLQDRKLDVGVATRPWADLNGLIEYPLLRDPFVLAVPAGDTTAPEDLLAGRSTLPFLRYSRDQIIGRLIETHLRRSRISLDNRFEMESNPSIMAMVADGSGWAITTPASYVRAQSAYGRVTLRPYPGKGFFRTVSVYTTDQYPEKLAQVIVTALHGLVSRHVVQRLCAKEPWLSDSFRTLKAGATA